MFFIQPTHIFVRIEEYDKINALVLFDFIDIFEYYHFYIRTQYIRSYRHNPSMVLVENYKGRSVIAGDVYLISVKEIIKWVEQGDVIKAEHKSYLVGYRIKCSDDYRGQIFQMPSSKEDVQKAKSRECASENNPLINLQFEYSDKISITVRNVGQGNWNEISYSDEVKIVYDTGAYMHATIDVVRKLIECRNQKYSKSKPKLILSHWDKDHYHALLGMSDEEIGQNFSEFVCKDSLPNYTSQILFNRIKKAINSNKIFTLSSSTRVDTPPQFERIYNQNNVAIYNAQHPKDRNLSGIAITVSNDTGNVILSGDAHYKQINRDILPYLTDDHVHYLIVPHHGGKAGDFVYNPHSNLKLTQAIISVGKNTYKHPLESIIDTLKDIGFKVLRTDEYEDNAGITFSL